MEAVCFHGSRGSSFVEAFSMESGLFFSLTYGNNPQPCPTMHREALSKFQVAGFLVRCSVGGQRGKARQG